MAAVASRAANGLCRNFRATVRLVAVGRWRVRGKRGGGVRVEDEESAACGERGGGGGVCATTSAIVRAASGCRGRRPWQRSGCDGSQSEIRAAVVAQPRGRKRHVDRLRNGYARV